MKFTKNNKMKCMVNGHVYLAEDIGSLEVRRDSQVQKFINLHWLRQHRSSVLERQVLVPSQTRALPFQMWQCQVQEILVQGPALVQ
jgi:hypothetical protein